MGFTDRLRNTLKVKTELEKVLSTVGVRGMDRKDGDGYTPMMTVGFIISLNPYNDTKN